MQKCYNFTTIRLKFHIHNLGFYRLSIGTNYNGSGPVYSEIGLINLLFALYSKMCAAQPVVLDITKIAVNNCVSILNLYIIHNTHINDMHLHCRNQDQDTSFSH